MTISALKKKREPQSGRLNTTETIIYSIWGLANGNACSELSIRKMVGLKTSKSMRCLDKES